MAKELSEVEKQAKEFLWTILIIKVENINSIDALEREKKELLSNIEISKENMDAFLRLLEQRKDILIKRGSIRKAMYKGQEIEVWSNNEHGFNYLPIVDNQKNMLPKYALINELTFI